MWDSTDDDSQHSHVDCLAQMVPHMLKRCGFSEKRPEIPQDTSPFTIQIVKTDVPLQVKSFGDCGMFLLKYIEYLSSGLPLTFQWKDIVRFREKMAVELWVGKLGC